MLQKKKKIENISHLLANLYCWQAIIYRPRHYYKPELLTKFVTVICFDKQKSERKAYRLISRE
jgi:hypothetical protein